jgi:hypothetical protein
MTDTDPTDFSLGLWSEPTVQPDVVENCTCCHFQRDGLCKRYPEQPAWDSDMGEQVQLDQPFAWLDGWCGEFVRGKDGFQ